MAEQSINVDETQVTVSGSCAKAAEEMADQLDAKMTEPTTMQIRQDYEPGCPTEMSIDRSSKQKAVRVRRVTK